MSEETVLKKDEKMQCCDCDTEFEIPKAVVVCEILTCPSCGLEFEVKQVESNFITLEELLVECGDWGSSARIRTTKSTRSGTKKKLA
jgi:hypothetical protein